MAKLQLSERARKFLREVGIIVLGVLVALCFGEIADAVRWKFRVGGSMNAIRQEMSGNRFNVAERLAYQPCVETRLAAIGGVLQDARRTGTLPELRNMGTVGMRLTEQYAYEVARSEGAPLHMESGQARELAQEYGVFAVYVSATQAERDSWTLLSTMGKTPGPVSDDLLADLLQAWSTAEEQAAFVGLMSRQIDKELSAMGIPIEFNPDAPTRSLLVQRAKNRALCRPMLVNGHPAIRT